LLLEQRHAKVNDGVDVARVSLEGFAKLQFRFGGPTPFNETGAFHVQLLRTMAGRNLKQPNQEQQGGFHGWLDRRPSNDIMRAGS